MMMKFIEEMMMTESAGETDSDGIEVAASSSSFTVSCDDDVSAAATLLCYLQERIVDMDTVVVKLKNLQDNVIAESFFLRKSIRCVTFILCRLKHFNVCVSFIF